MSNKVFIAKLVSIIFTQLKLAFSYLSLNFQKIIVYVFCVFSFCTAGISQEREPIGRYDLPGTEDDILIYTIQPDTFYSNIKTTFTITGKNLNSIDFAKVKQFLEQDTLPFTLPKFSLESQLSTSLQLITEVEETQITSNLAGGDLGALLSKYIDRLELSSPIVNDGELHPEITEIWINNFSELMTGGSFPVTIEPNSSYSFKKPIRILKNKLINSPDDFQWLVTIKGKDLIGNIENADSLVSKIERKQTVIETTFRYNPYSDEPEKSGTLKLKIPFTLGESTVTLPDVDIQLPITPYNSSTKWAFYLIPFLLYLLTLFFNFAISSETIKNSTKELELPYIGMIIGFWIWTSIATWICATLFNVFGAFSMDNIANNYDNKDITWTIFLISLNVANITWFYKGLRAAKDIIEVNFLRFPLFLLLLFIPFSIPFFVEARYEELNIFQWLMALESTVFLGVLWFGVAGFKRIEKAYAKKKAEGPSIEVISSLMEEKLLRQGSLNLDKDFPDIIRSSLNEAAKQFYDKKKPDWRIELNLEAGQLYLERGAAVKDINDIFSEIKKNISNPSELEAKIKQLADKLEKHLNLEKGNPFNLPKNKNGFNVFSYYSKELEAVLPNPFPLIIYCSANSDFTTQKKAFQSILNSLDIPSRFSLLTTITEMPISREVIKSSITSFENVALLREQDLYEIFANKKELRAALMEKIQEQIDLIIFSPYRTKAPTTSDMFYGRKREVGTIVEQIKEGSIVILGARRMGKTSVLQSVQRELINPERKTYFLYLDCYHITDYDAFFRELANRWQIPGMDLSKYKQLLDFPDFVLTLQKKIGKKYSIVFEFDEIDRLLHYDSSGDRDEQFFRMLRSLAQEKRCQFIFSGERKILDQLSNPKSCFFNFAQPVKLNLLDKPSALDLIRIPTKLISILWENEDIPEIIFEYSSGHPNLIQHICELCIEELSDTKSRWITKDLVLRKCQDNEYKDTFMETFWSQSSPLEKAITVIVAQKGKCKKNEIIEALLDFDFTPTIAEFEKGLKYLDLCQLLGSDGENYFMVSAKFVEYLFKNGYSYKMWLESFLREYKRN